MALINTELLRNPFNWATVFLMALFFVALLCIVFPENS